MRNKVKEYRHTYGVSQTALAEAVGVTKRTIYSIETENQNISVILARKLAVYFGCGIDDLFDFDDGAHTTTDKAIWFTHVVRYTAETLGKPIRETVKLLEKSGLAKLLITGYDMWHTQGYEYMAEMLTEELDKQEGVA